MTSITAASLAAAAERLRGHVVATPLIGTPWLPLESSLPDVRWKPELLQPGGSAWWRGYQHFLLRQLGRCAGLVYAGPPERLLAAALAAMQHRVPLHAMLPVDYPSSRRQLLPADLTLECRVSPAAAESLARKRGFTILPDERDADVMHGLATVACELADGLPQHCELVLAPTDLQHALAAGLAAAGRPLTVASPPADICVRPQLREAVAHGHGIALGDGSLRVLSAALAAEPSSCVGAVLAD
jgi:threonine dehydratase